MKLMEKTNREEIIKSFDNLNASTKIVMSAVYGEFQKIQNQEYEISKQFGDYSAVYPVKIDDNNIIKFAIVKREIRPDEMYYGFYLAESGASKRYYISYDEALVAGLMYANTGNAEGAEVAFRAIGLNKK